MSKSIYEEALKRIRVEFDAWDRAEHLELFELVEQALEQAQKQEKLLELYKELATVRGDMLYCYEVVDFIAYNSMKKKKHN